MANTKISEGTNKPQEDVTGDEKLPTGDGSPLVTLTPKLITGVRNPTIPATAGLVEVIFDGINADYVPFEITGNIVFTVSSLKACSRKITIDGNGTHSITIPTNWLNRNGGVFDVDKRNSILVYRDANEPPIFEYTLFNDDIPGSGYLSYSLAVQPDGNGVMRSELDVINPTLGFTTGAADLPFWASFWLKREGDASSFEFMISMPQWHIRIGDGGGSDNIVTVHYDDVNGGFIGASANVDVPLSVWGHFIVSYEPGVGFVIYRNGVLVSSTSLGSGTYVCKVFIGLGYRFALGGASDGTSGLSDYLLSNVHLLSGVPDSGDIVIAYNSGVPINLLDTALAGDVVTLHKLDGDGLDLGPNGFDLTSVSGDQFTADVP